MAAEDEAGLLNTIPSPRDIWEWHPAVPFFKDIKSLSKVEKAMLVNRYCDFMRIDPEQIDRTAVVAIGTDPVPTATVRPSSTRAQ